MVNDSEWAQKAADKFREQRINKQKEKESAIEEQKLVKEQGKLLWNELRNALRDKSQQFNSAMQEKLLIFEVVQNDMLLLSRTDASMRIEGSYVESSCEVNITVRPVECHFQYKAQLIPGQGKVKLMDLARGHAEEPEYIAEKILNEVLGRGH